MRVPLLSLSLVLLVASCPAFATSSMCLMSRAAQVLLEIFHALLQRSLLGNTPATVVGVDQWMRFVALPTRPLVGKLHHLRGLHCTTVVNVQNSKEPDQMCVRKVPRRCLQDVTNSMVEFVVVEHSVVVFV